MRRPCNRELALLSLLGCLACLAVGARADASSLGRVFMLELYSGSKGAENTGFEAATNACITQGARVASGADLHHAVLECAFSACSRGWLSGPSVGTTVCSGVPGSMRPVDVQLENVTGDTERLGVFCVKDSDAPCGQPPLFPNSHLQGKTGLDLGDELLYACNEGYKLPNGETAFSLVCDSCGEWYGMVQHCFKDDPEGHIDYEDKFTDDHHLLEIPEEVHSDSTIPGETTDHEVVESTPLLEHARAVVSEEEDNEDDSTVSVTEPPVSQLSQKHMFWFPSEAFQEEEERSVISTDSSVKSPTEDQNYMTVKTHDSPSESDVIQEEHDPNPDPDYDPVADPPTDDPVSHSVGSTEESWLDGYPVSQEDDKAGGESTGESGPEHGLETETVTGHSEVDVYEDVTKSPVEEETGGLTDSPEEEDIEGVTSNPEDTKYEEGSHIKGDGEELEGGTTRSEDDKFIRVKEFPVVTHHDGATEGFTESKVGKEMYPPEETASENENDRSIELGFDGVTDRPNIVEMKPTTFIRATQITSSMDDVALGKRRVVYTPATAPENVSTSQEGLSPEHTTTPSGMVLLDTTPAFTDDVITRMATPIIKVSWETDDNSHFLEHVPDYDTTEIPENQSGMERGGDHSLDQQEGAGKGACAQDPCHVSGRGPMIAAIIVGIVAAVVGVILGVWCYKKRQQKSSHYQLNGTNRQTQCIELQQTV